MITISKRVGLNADNHHEDVKKVQELLNKNRHISGHREIDEDFRVGPVLKQFQRKVIKFSNPDGKIDPNGKTITSLNERAISGDKPAALPPKSVKPPSDTSYKNTLNISFQFPLKSRSNNSYKRGARYYGANRDDGKRLHAGCDLRAEVGENVYAVADGVIKAYRKFYSGTWQVIVAHKGGFVVRYGEVEANNLAPGLKVGSDVSTGQLIAYVGKLNSGSHMLHFELYSGSESGNLTVRNNKPYQRRADLVDPTDALDNASLP